MKFAIAWSTFSFLLMLVLGTMILKEPHFWDPDFEYTGGEFYATDLSRWFLNLFEGLFLCALAIFALSLGFYWGMVSKEGEIKDRMIDLGMGSRP